MNKEKRLPAVTENRLKEILTFKPVEKLGQNFLIDPLMVNKMANSTIRGADVVEIGTGPGNMTKGSAARASDVTALEIFPGFAEAQEIILAGCHNVRIINQNALKFDYQKWVNTDREARHQVIGNIPFNISEPLLTTLAGVSDKIENITLLVGDNLASIMTTTNPRDDRYSRLSFISGIFDISRVAHVPRTCFWPVPRTDADIISMTPKEYPSDGNMFGFQLRKKIVLDQAANLTLAKVLNGFSYGSETGKILDKDLSHRFDRRQTRSELKRAVRDLGRTPIGRREIDSDSMKTMRSLITRIGLSAEILSKPFTRLNNDEVRKLAMAIDNL